MPRPVHFEIHACDPERAMDFYTTVFGWKFDRVSTIPYWHVDTGEDVGINGGLLALDGVGPADAAAMNAYTTTMEVADLDKALRLIDEQGGAIIMARQPLTRVGWLAYCKDTEGNLFGIMETDASAA